MFKQNNWKCIYLIKNFNLSRKIKEKPQAITSAHTAYRN